MLIEIPADVERFVIGQAERAGYDNARDYMLSLVLNDTTNGSEICDSDRLESLALEGLRSGPATPLDMNAIRAEFRRRLTERTP